MPQSADYRPEPSDGFDEHDRLAYYAQAELDGFFDQDEENLDELFGDDESWEAFHDFA